MKGFVKQPHSSEPLPIRFWKCNKRLTLVHRIILMRILNLLALSLLTSLMTGCASDGSVDWNEVANRVQKAQEGDDKRTGKSSSNKSTPSKRSCSLVSKTPVPSSMINGVPSRYYCNYDCGMNEYRSTEESFCMSAKLF